MRTLIYVFLGAALLGTVLGADKYNEKESKAVGAMRSINTAEVYYAKTYPDRGFACSLESMLISPMPEPPNADHAGLLDRSLKDTKVRRYTFEVYCRDGKKPAKTYESWALPLDKSSRGLCSDETGIIRWAEKTPDVACANSGKPIQ